MPHSFVEWGCFSRLGAPPRKKIELPDTRQFHQLAEAVVEMKDDVRRIYNLAAYLVDGMEQFRDDFVWGLSKIERKRRA